MVKAFDKHSCMYGMHSEFSGYVVSGRFIGRNKSLYDRQIFISKLRWFLLNKYGLINKRITVISVNLLFAYYLHISY